jgi:hypothetical protein
MVGGIAYYGERRVAELRGPADVERFFDAGGRAVVLKAKKLESLGATVEVIHRVRSRDRALVVVTQRSDAAVRHSEGRGGPPMATSHVPEPIPGLE